MYLTKKELTFMYENLPESELKDRVKLELFVDEEIVACIKDAFKNPHSIWKKNNENSYYVKFYIDYTEESEVEEDEFKEDIAVGIRTESNPDVEVDVLEIDIDNKDTEDDWMYSGYDLIWSKDSK